MSEKIQTLKNMINECHHIVVMTGAGVSTLSGIPDFRSKNGLYNLKYQYNPEEILSHHFFIQKTAEFYKFYRDKLNPLGFQPNIIHKYLSKLEQSHKLEQIITQNIDGLHTIAGNKKVVELHGSCYRNYCMKCGHSYDVETLFQGHDIPKCQCGGLIKPDVVLYEEALKEEDIQITIKSITNADMMIILGTSLMVYPAASFVQYFKGKYLVIINNDQTNYDHMCDLVIHDDLKNVFEQLEANT